MDSRDSRIVELLMSNSRTPITQLAKKAKVSREVANYRIKNLEKTGIIMGYYPVINYSALGFKRYGYFIQLKGISAKEEERFMEYLNNHEFVSYFGPVIGRWNVAFDIIAHDEEHLTQIHAGIISETKQYLDTYLISGIGGSEEIYSTKIIGKSNFQKKKKKITKKYEIDELDKKILHLMSKNARIEYHELSQKLKVAANTIKYRIKNMEKSGIIEDYALSIDYTKLGLQMHTIQFKISGDDNKLISYLRSNKHIWFYYKYLGQETWDMAIGVFVKNPTELRNVLIELKDNFGELIKIHDMFLVTHIIKDNIAPAGIFK